MPTTEHSIQSFLAGQPAEMEFRVEISPRLEVGFKVTPSYIWQAYLEALAQCGRDIKRAVEDDVPVDLNFRVSAQEVGKLVDSPEQMVRECVEWCAVWKRRPAALLVEYIGSTVFTRRRRRLWHAWQRDLLDGLIVDSITGAAIKESVVWEYTRYSRNPDEATPYVRARQRKPGYNLHQAREADEGPKRLTPERANQIIEKIVEGERYVIMQRRAGMRANRAKAELGYPVGKSRGIWHLQDGAGPRKRMVLKPEMDAAGIDMYLSVVAWESLESIGARYGMKAERVAAFVRSPSNAGLIRLRVDEERALDDDYDGELFPKFLLVDQPEEECVYTPKAILAERRLDTPIQQGVPYWLWRRANEELDSRPAPTRGVKQGERALGSGFLRCPCGRRHKHQANSYSCGKYHLLPTGRKRGRQPRYDVASDGRRHSKIADYIANLVLRELTFACHRAAEISVEFERARATAATQAPSHTAARRAACEAELRAIYAERERIKTLFRAGMMNEQEMLAAANDLKQQETATRIELAGISKEARRQRRTLVQPGQTVESAWAEAERNGNTDWQRRLVGTYIDHIIVKTNKRRLADRLEVVFVDGLEVPADQVRALLEDLYRDIIAGQKRTRTPQETIEVAIALYDARNTPTEIANALNAAGHRTAKSSRGYTATSVLAMLERELSKRGRAYIPPPRKHIASQSLLETIDSLDRAGKPYVQIAAALNKSGQTTPRGKQWDATDVARYLQRRLRTPKRPNSGHLPRPVEEELLRKRTLGHTLRELSDWLAAERWSTRSGRPWHVGTVACILRRVERDHRRDGAGT